MKCWDWNEPQEILEKKRYQPQMPDIASQNSLDDFAFRITTARYAKWEKK
jgi:hypothetical protein